MPIKSVTRQLAHDTRRRAIRRKVTVTLSLADFADFLRVASAARESVPRTVAQLAKAQLQAEPLLSKADRDLLKDHARQLAAIGNNLNQIAHACHLHSRAGKVPEAAQCLKFLQNLYEQLNRLENGFPSPS